MEAAVTLKGTPAEFDQLRTALHERIAELTLVVEGTASTPERAAARKKRLQYTDLLTKLQ